MVKFKCYNDESWYVQCHDIRFYIGLGTITNIPKHMVTDQFGMIGLLTFIRAAETKPNLVTLALGR